MGVGAANDRRVKKQAEGKIWRERESAQAAAAGEES
jgi:hypothetical protein